MFYEILVQKDKMVNNSYEILLKCHKVGHPIDCRVIGYDFFDHEEFPTCDVLVDAKSKFICKIPFNNLFDGLVEFNKKRLPLIGEVLKSVVSNHVDDTLYLSTRPKDISWEEIEKYKDYYRLVDKLEIGEEVTGKVVRVMSFGIFVQLGFEYLGLVDVGHIRFNSGQPLPLDSTKWPNEGDEITCIQSYFRLHSRQIGLGWKPNLTS